MARKSRRTQRLRVVNPDCAGIDIGKDRHFVAVDPERTEEPVRSFGAFTRDLEEMAAWLASCGVTKVAMESTSVYWIPVYETLGACAVEVLMLGDWRAAAGEVGFWPECGHLARPTLGWKSLTGRPERKRFAFHTRSMGTARPGASALAGQHLPQHVATVPTRLMFNAKHTRFHSPRTFAKPRRLNRRNPSTSVNGGGIMLHARRPGGPVAAAQKCATHGPLSVATRGGGCTAWSSMRRFDWRLSTRV